MKPKMELVLRLSAAFAVIIGVSWTAVNLWQAGDYKRKMQVKLDTIVQLQEMKRQNDTLEAAFAALAAVSNPAPTLAVLAAGAIPGSVPEIREIETRELERGWKAKKAEVAFRDVDLDLIADFLRSAETQRPPWRLSGCVITSSSKADGYGNAILTMETATR